MTCHAIHRGGRRHGRVRLLATTFLSTILTSGLVPGAALAEEIPEVVISAPRLSIPAEAKAGAAGDTARLLSGTPGLNLITNGGVSSLPDIHGLADDRLKIVVDGADITSACSNHMNPALSYMDSSKVERVEVWSGITPVSAGGDNIGGVISVKSAPPVFAAPGESYVTGGRASAFFKSVNSGIGGSLAVHGADDTYSLGYDGSWVRGLNYAAGGDGRTVHSTRYESRNQELTLGVKGSAGLLVLKAGQQDIPFQGFANQRMDMTGNRGYRGNLRYEGEFGWGRLEARTYWQLVAHSMNQAANEKGGNMPMRTDATDLGYAVKGDIRLSRTATVRVGQEFHRFMLDDWWPALASGGMSPLSFQSINNGTRDVIGAFAEWEEKWSPQWTTLLGLRSDTVLMNTGHVHGYKATGTEATDAAAFNGRNHGKVDVNFDITALVRYEPADTSTNEFGYARKTRSPNLYERYSWSTSTMNSRMINWFGDANGYVGNLDLKPEVAHTASASFALHDAARRDWAAKATPYFTYIADYIGVDFVTNPAATNGSTFPLLKFANHDAMMYGVDFSGSAFLARDTGWGDFKASGTIGWLHGEMVNTGKAMYHVMPINGKAALEHGLGGWTNAVEVQLVGTKAGVDNLRREPKTPGYALLNLRSGYEWENVQVNFGIDNLFDKRYYHPLGGVDYSDWRRNGWTGQVGALPAPGRSLNAGVTVRF